VHGSVLQESAPDPPAGVIRVYRHLLDVKAAVHRVRDEIARWLVVWANCYPGKPGSPATVEDADRKRCVRSDLRHPDICEHRPAALSISRNANSSSCRTGLMRGGMSRVCGWSTRASCSTATP